ncbi:MAG: hypothetical protein HYX69_01210 [Planctomycetia bacterium]|nr:hypothetical protein [Planctomycetia bacterium]
MGELDRRTFIRGLGASITLASGVQLAVPSSATASQASNAHLTRANPEFLVSRAQAQAWHVAKDSKGGPTIAGSRSWKHFLEIVENELRAGGVVDVLRNPWTYTRWSTTEWPDDSNWSLHVDGQKIKVASYGCNSGKTPAEGITGELVVFRQGMPAAELKGKIAIVLKPTAVQYYEDRAGSKPLSRPPNPLSVGDYEFLSSGESFPDPLRPMAQMDAVSPFTQMGLGADERALTEAGAVGALIVIGLSYEALAGIYTFPVPALYDLPTLYVDRDTGASLVEAAKSGKKAVLRLISRTEDVETYQLFGYLPGRDYKTPTDEQILLITHTDGPSISQENGALGILGMVKYFSHIPPAERPRTLMIFLDCRHYMPGAERAFAAQDYSQSHPDIYQLVVAAMGIEHLGQIQVAEGDGKPYHKTELPEVSSLWVSKNQQLIDMAIKAVKDNRLARVQVQCPDRPGVHGKPQGRQFGLGAIAGRLGVAGASTMGMMAAYWSSKARIDYFDAKHFVDQVATMSQICGGLMTAELAAR